MSLFNSFDRNRHFGELSEPLETQGEGVKTPAQRRLAARANIFGNTDAKIGYETGQGGAVTQGTSRTTAVQLDTLAGAITLFTAAGSATAATFTVNNAKVAATDVIALSVKSSTTNKYVMVVSAVTDGSFDITFFTTGGTTSDAPVVNFAVIKAVAA